MVSEMLSVCLRTTRMAKRILFIFGVEEFISYKLVSGVYEYCNVLKGSDDGA